MNYSSQLFIIVFVIACAVMSMISLEFRNQQIYAGIHSQKAPIALKWSHCACLPAGVYFALFTFHAFTGGFSFDVQFM